MASNPGGGTLVLDITPPANATNATIYRVTIAAVDGSFSLTQTTASTAFTATGLAVCQNFSVSVIAENGPVQSPTSNTLYVVTTCYSPPPPPSPPVRRPLLAHRPLPACLPPPSLPARPPARLLWGCCPSRGDRAAPFCLGFQHAAAWGSMPAEQSGTWGRGRGVGMAGQAHRGAARAEGGGGARQAGAALSG